VERRAEHYRYRFGEIPQFKAGFHFGRAVIAEMGHSKKEIALIGDAMNACARLEQACKDTGQDLLASEEALVRVPLPSTMVITGTYQGQLRGKEEVTVYHGLQRRLG
jgi:adenylate cyclase